MNGFYTCLFGNAVTTVALLHGGPYGGVGVIVVFGLLSLVAERAHIERFLKKGK